ncbi:MAG: S1C family serine protease [Planctomycetota bacterium]|nr:S1C family serine protease [Planctomycetota bacterium]
MRKVVLFVLLVFGAFYLTAAETPHLRLLSALEKQMQRAAEKVAPSVVSVYVERDFSQKEGEEIEGWLPGRAAGQGGQYRTRPNAPVSGVIISEDGIIATTRFNVRGKNIKQITVHLPDGRVFEGVRLGYDENTDVALIKIEADGLPALKFFDTTALKVGQFIAVVGRAEDRVSLTLNIGIISALNRISGNCFQHDAQLNYGNAGGAVVDIYGNFLGIASYVSTESPAGQNSGVGFAAPAHKIKERLKEMVAGNRIEKEKVPYIGVVAAEGAEDVKGAVIARVEPNTPAEDAGLKENDVIVEFNGKKIENWDDLRLAIKECKVGQRVKLKAKRTVEGVEKIEEMELTLGARPF